MNADGSNQRRLSNDDASDEFPLWSPPVISWSFQHGQQRTATFLIHSDGSRLTELALRRPARTGRPTGHRRREIVFVSDRTGSRISTRSRRMARPAPAYVVRSRRFTPLVVRWSAGSLCLAPRWQCEIYVMNAHGSKLTRLTNTPVDESDPDWSPDDRRIAFAAGKEVLTMDANGSHRHQLTNGADTTIRGCAGRRTGATCLRQQPRRQPRNLRDQWGRLGLKRLTDNPTFDGNPTWAPSCRRLRTRRQPAIQCEQPYAFLSKRCMIMAHLDLCAREFIV